MNSTTQFRRESMQASYDGDTAAPIPLPGASKALIARGEAARWAGKAGRRSRAAYLRDSPKPPVRYETLPAGA